MNKTRVRPVPAIGRTAKIPLSVLPGLVLVVASLYWAQTFLIPLALSLLFTFLLTPLVAGLEKFGLRRVPSVMIVVLFVFSLLGAIAWIVTVQFTSVANQLPRYQSNIRQKIADIRGAGKGGVFEKVKETAKEVTEELEQEPSAAQTPREVVVQGDEGTTFWPVSPVVAPMLERMAGAGFVFVLTVFMLIRRENLRNRLIHLLGYGRLTVTTKAMEEAGQRISRYLVVQSLLNGSFGIAVGGALFFFGLPYAILWGFLAALLRFIPYIGSWAAAILPYSSGSSRVSRLALAVAGFRNDRRLRNCHCHDSRTFAIRRKRRCVRGGHARVRGVLDLALGSGWTATRHAANGLCGRNRQIYAADGIYRRVVERWVDPRAGYRLLSTFARRGSR